MESTDTAAFLKSPFSLLLGAVGFSISNSRPYNNSSHCVSEVVKYLNPPPPLHPKL
jgi:hypothetical protein